MFASENNLQVDLDQIAQQLELLGYKAGEKVFLRAFYPSDDPRKTGDKGRKGEATTVELIAQAAEMFQSNGRGVYFVVNGSGQKDAEVKACRAIFYEHDNLSKELQLDLWRSLGLPEPTFQVDTGGKSIHSYWVFDQPIRPFLWRALQADLLEFADADRSLKNPSRVMRLAGCYHISIANGANKSVIVTASGTRYSFEELRAIVPTQPKTPSPSLPLPTFTDNVPLAECLSRTDRELIVGGAAPGGRNMSGAKLARNLIGTELRLQYLGIQHSGNARQLFDDYCSRCSPPLDAREADQIWKSATESNPTATLTDDAILNCVKAWQWKQSVPAGKNNSVQNSIVSTDNGLLSVPPLTMENLDNNGVQAIVSDVSGILGSCLDEIEEGYKLDQLCTEAKIDRRLFNRIVARERVKLDEVLPEDEMRLKSLIDWRNTKIEWDAILPAPLARDLTHDGDVLNIDPVVIWQPLMSAVASLAGTKVNLDMQSHRIPSVLWTVTVLESGGGKTRADSLVVAPLRSLQSEAMQRYHEADKEYRRSLKEWEKNGSEGEEPQPPVLRKFLYEVATIQSVLKRSAENEGHGSLWARDEVAGLFNSLGQFSKGEDESLQILLKLWDAAALCVDRVSLSDSYFAERTAVSLTGGIQPGVFRKIFKDADDSNGLQARMLFAVPQRRKQRYVEGYCQLSSRLPLLYKWLDELPETTVKISPQAKAYYKKLVEVIGDQIEETTHPAIRNWMSKLTTQILRIALNLHMIECFYSQSRDINTLQKETLLKAVRLAQYYRSAFHVLQEKVSNSDEISSILLQIYDRALQSTSGISARDIYRPMDSIKTRAKSASREPSAYTEDLFNQLVKMGYGEIVRKGRSVKFVAFKKEDLEKPFTATDNTDNEEKLTYDSLSNEEINVSDDHCQKEIVSTDNSDLPLDHGEPPVPDESAILPEPISLLQFETDGCDITKYVGCQVEVRSFSGEVKFTGEMTHWDATHGNITVATTEGARMAHIRESFLIG